MTDRDATSSFLVCFTGTDTSDHHSGVRVCLGANPGGSNKSLPYFFTVTLSNVRVQLPSPLPGTAPVVGTVNLDETLALSAADIANLRTWLDDFAAPKHPKE